MYLAAAAFLIVLLLPLFGEGYHDSPPSRYTGVHETRFVDGAVVSKDTKPIQIGDWIKQNQESLETIPQNVAKKSTLSTIWDKLTKGEGSYATYLSGWAGVTDTIRLS